MKNTALFTITGNYWHFHPIGVGVVFTYHVSSKQVITTCEFSAQVIEVVDYNDEGGFETPEEFRESAVEIYMQMVEEDGATIVLDYLDEPTIVGCIGVDFDLLKN